VPYEFPKGRLLLISDSAVDISSAMFFCSEQIFSSGLMGRGFSFCYLLPRPFAGTQAGCVMSPVPWMIASNFDSA
jgi:hypothetical protein